MIVWGTLLLAVGASEVSGSALFQRRLDPAALDQALVALAAESTAQPSALLPRVLLARAEAFWDQLHPDASTAEAAAHLSQGVDAAEAALDLASPAYATAARRKLALPACLAALQPAEAEPLYWLAVDLHRLASRRGLAALLLEADELRLLFEKVVELQPSTFHGGAYRHLAELDLALPWGFTGGLEKAAGELHQAEALGPDFLGTQLVWAERWAVKAQDYATFQRCIQKILKTGMNLDPALAPENELTRAQARALVKQASDLFTRGALARGLDGGIQPAGITAGDPSRISSP